MIHLEALSAESQSRARLCDGYMVNSHITVCHTCGSCAILIKALLCVDKVAYRLF